MAAGFVAIAILVGLFGAGATLAAGAGFWAAVLAYVLSGNLGLLLAGLWVALHDRPAPEPPPHPLTDGRTMASHSRG